MTYLLNAQGHTVLYAEDGEQGLKAARWDSPDLIVCDVGLPGLGGWELVRRLKSDPWLRAVPLVALTALVLVGNQEQSLATGFDGYVPKPVDPEAFVAQ